MGYCKLQCMLREKGMLNKVSPMDLMDEYAKELMSEVPKKVRELDEKLELNLFPKWCGVTVINLFCLSRNNLGVHSWYFFISKVIWNGVIPPLKKYLFFLSSKLKFLADEFFLLPSNTRLPMALVSVSLSTSENFLTHSELGGGFWGNICSMVITPPYPPKLSWSTIFKSNLKTYIPQMCTKRKIFLHLYNIIFLRVSFTELNNFY